MMKGLFDLTDEDIRSRAEETGGNPSRMVEDFKMMTTAVKELLDVVDQTTETAATVINSSHTKDDATFNQNGIRLALVETLLDKIVDNSNTPEAIVSLINMVQSITQRIQARGAERLVFIINEATRSDDKKLNS